MFEKQMALISELSKSPIGIFELIVAFIIRLCILSLFIAIAINFIEARTQVKTKFRKNSIVETGTMILFFFGFYYIIHSGFGSIQLQNLTTRVILAVIGVIVIIFGTTFNILGRLALGKNWANQVKIYDDQTLVQKGVYKIVRHPLYASLIWMFFASSIIYLNCAAFLANLCIFIPFMTYRAKQEEYLLTKQFPDYKKYQRTTGMFFPKFGGNNETN